MIMQQCGYVNMPMNNNNNLGIYKAWFSNAWSSQPSSNFKSLKLTCRELAQGHEAKSLEQARRLVPGSLGTPLHFNASARYLRWSSVFLYKEVFLLLHLESIKTSKAQDVRESSFKLTPLSTSSMVMERDVCYLAAWGFAVIIFFLPVKS